MSHGWSGTSSKNFKIWGCAALILCCIISLLLFHQFITSSPSKYTFTKNNIPTITITAGFDNTYRSNYWAPIRITIHTSRSAFQGSLIVRTSAGNDNPSSVISPDWRFEQSVHLDKNTTKLFTTSAPYYTDNLLAHGFLASLLTPDGKTIVQQESRIGNEVQPGNMLIGTLSRDGALHRQLARILLPDQSSSITVSDLTASTFPTQEAVLENFDIIVLDNFASRALSSQQVDTLRTWVNQGGILIGIGGNSWQQTLAPLPPDLLPVILQGKSTLPPGTHVLSFSGNTTSQSHTDMPPSPPVISTASIHAQSAFSQLQTLLAIGSMPLIVKAHQGAGNICYLAFDPASPPLNSWSGASTLWQSLLQETLGERLIITSSAQSYDEGPGNLLTRGGLMGFLVAGAPQSPVAIGILLLCYLLLLGPIRLLLIHRYRWIQLQQWRVLMSSIVIFATLAYGLAAYQKNVSITENSVSIFSINQNGSSAHTTTYMGVLFPQTGDVRLQMPGKNLIEPIGQAYLPAMQTTQPTASNTPVTATVRANTDGTNMTLHPTNSWSLNPVITEQDQQLSGKLSGHILLVGNHLVGNVTNTLSTSLNDVYILLPHTFVAIGNLAPLQTHEINDTIPITQPPPELTLSDLIARHMGLPTQYFPFLQKKQPQTEQENQMAMLEALSGVGYSYAACQGPCLTHAIVSKNELYVTGGQIPDPNLKNDYDPLLIQGSAATLIGWSNQNPTSSDSTPTTVNGIIPQGHHMNFIQMPLSVSYAGQFNIPTDFIAGNLIDVESYDAGAILPGAYSLSTGYVTFELPLPSPPSKYIHSATITVPNLLTHPSGPGSGSNAQTNNIRAKLYNWNTQNWTNIALQSDDSFTTTQMQQFIGPDARILVRIANKNSSNQIYFGKPDLYLNGSAN